MCAGSRELRHVVRVEIEVEPDVAVFELDELVRAAEKRRLSLARSRRRRKRSSHAQDRELVTWVDGRDERGYEGPRPWPTSRNTPGRQNESPEHRRAFAHRRERFEPVGIERGAFQSIVTAMTMWPVDRAVPTNASMPRALPATSAHSVPPFSTGALPRGTVNGGITSGGMLRHLQREPLELLACT